MTDDRPNVNLQSQDYYYYRSYYGAKNYKSDVEEDTERAAATGTLNL